MEWGVFIDTPKNRNLIEEVADAGIKHIEILNSLSFFEERAEESIKNIKSFGLNIWSVHMPFDEEHDLSSLENEKRIKTIETIRKIVEIVSPFLPLKIIIHPGKEVKDDTERIVRRDACEKSIETLLVYAEKMDFEIAVENMLPGQIGDTAKELTDIIKKFSSKRLGVCFDTGHAHVKKNLIEEYKLLKNYVSTFHIHDNDGTSDMHIQPPYGTIDWEKFFKEVRDSGFVGPLMLECRAWGGCEIAWAMKELDALVNGKLMKFKGSYLVCGSCGHYLQEGMICCCKKYNKDVKQSLNL